MSIEKIPKTIIQFWHDKTTLPDVYIQAMEKNRINNSDFQLLYVDDCFMYEFLKKNFHPCLLALYQTNKIASSRSDIVRFTMLYIYGGVWLDAAIELNKPLNSFLDFEKDIVLIQRTDAEMFKDFPEQANVASGIIGAAPRSAFIHWCIEKIIANLLSGAYNTDVLAATGPVVTNQALKNHKESCDIQLLSFKELKAGFLNHIRIKGLSNSWMPLQADGIIDDCQLAKLKESYQEPFKLNC